MSKNHWVIADGNFLAHRSFYTTGGLSFNGEPTGVSYGILREIWNLIKHFGTENIIFCWDHGTSLRKQFYSEYKGIRNTEFSEEKQQIHNQILSLKTYILPQLGLENNFYLKGFEGDDLIASVVQSYPNYTFTIISADKDLYQLLRHNVSIWNPITKKEMTVDRFKDKYSINPDWWVRAKAIMGEGKHGDNIPGVEGIGEKLAIKYLKKELKIESKAYLKIRSEESREIIKRNLKLVTLPWEGTPKYDLSPNTFSIARWNFVLESHGIKSLRVFEKEGLLFDENTKER